ncbi:MAG: hypothetical protein AB2610_20875 [Candidatus Thiodiazotropha sp.]
MHVFFFSGLFLEQAVVDLECQEQVLQEQAVVDSECLEQALQVQAVEDSECLERALQVQAMVECPEQVPVAVDHLQWDHLVVLQADQGQVAVDSGCLGVLAVLVSEHREERALVDLECPEEGLPVLALQQWGRLEEVDLEMEEVPADLDRTLLGMVITQMDL